MFFLRNKNKSFKVQLFDVITSPMIMLTLNLFMIIPTDLQEQLAILEDFHNRLNDFHDTVNTSQISLANFEEQLALHDAPGKLDPKNLQKLKVRSFICQGSSFSTIEFNPFRKSCKVRSGIIFTDSKRYMT